MRTVLIHLRKSFKLIYCLFKPMYAVKLNGEIIGYTDAKKQLQEKIDESIQKGDGSGIAFFEIDTLPEYEVCYSKKDIEANEDEVFDTVIATGTPYYKNFAIMQNGEEKSYVATYEEAEKVIADLREKNSTNIDSITYDTKYSSEKLENSDVETIVTSLYVEPAPIVTTSEKTTVKKTTTTAKGTVNTSQTVSYGNVALGVFCLDLLQEQLHLDLEEEVEVHIQELMLPQAKERL